MSRRRIKKLFLSSSPSGNPLRAFFVMQSRGGVCLKSVSVLFFYYELRIIFSIFSFHKSLDTIDWTGYIHANYHLLLQLPRKWHFLPQLTKRSRTMELIPKKILLTTITILKIFFSSHSPSYSNFIPINPQLISFYDSSFIFLLLLLYVWGLYFLSAQILHQLYFITFRYKIARYCTKDARFL